MLKETKISERAALNPALVFWTLPLVILETWWKVTLSLSVRSDQKDRTAKGTKQLPVPVVLQDDSDRELFA
jgi:hypothetical protein